MTRFELTVVTWNMQARSPASQGLGDLLERWQPDLLLLIEANGDRVAAEPEVAERYPHRFVRRGAGTAAGMAIFSTVPLADMHVLSRPSSTWDRERVLVARLADGPARGLLIAAVHLRAPMVSWMPLLPFDRAPRARQLRGLASWAASVTAAGDQILIGGDFNTHDCRLPGLVNVAEALGRRRPTWRPYGIPFAPPVLRIDHLFVSGGLTARSLDIECRPTGSDHCALIGSLAGVALGFAETRSPASGPPSAIHVTDRTQQGD